MLIELFQKPLELLRMSLRLVKQQRKELSFNLLTLLWEVKSASIKDGFNLFIITVLFFNVLIFNDYFQI